jgi:hypothetical protein
MPPQSSPSTRTAWAGVASVLSLVAASVCCLPVLPFMAAAGLAGTSAFLSAARPYLLGVSLLAIGYGFYQARRAKQCGRRPGIAGPTLLWLSLAIVAVSILFPQALANLVAGTVQTPHGQPPLAKLDDQPEAVRNAFNAARADVRLVVLLSPT